MRYDRVRLASPNAIARGSGRAERGRWRMTTAREHRGLVDAVMGQVEVERAVALVQEVCRIPSVLGEEGRLAETLASVMSQYGFEEVELQPALPDRPNAVGQVSFGPGRRVVLTGHLDTKPASHGWQRTSPFSGELI